jgi:hypothetical protein
MRRITLVCLVLTTAAALLTACGPEETPEQHLERLRYNHEIIPVAAKTLYDAEGNPTLLVDLQVSNQGTEPLSQLTVLVTVLGPDGTVKHARRATLDLGDLRPGIGARVSAALEGIELMEDDDVTVELEHGLTPDDLRTLPEWSVVGSAS